jgi:hypothetical protein
MFERIYEEKKAEKSAQHKGNKTLKTKLEAAQGRQEARVC